MVKLRKPFFIFLGIAGGLFLAIITATLLLEPKIKRLAVQQINHYLTVPVQVDDISFSLLRKFPYASITFEGLHAKGKTVQGAAEPLLEAKKIHLLFNLFDVFSDELHLHEIDVTGARLFMLTDIKGNNNYDIFRKSAGNTNSFSLELEEVKLKDVRFSLVNVLSARDYRLLARDMNLSGHFTDTAYNLKADGKLFAEKFRISEVNYLHEKELLAGLVIHVNQKDGIFSISPSSLQVADMLFNVTGTIKNLPVEGYLLDLSVNSEQAGIRELISLVPGMYTERLNQYRYDGGVRFGMHVKGITDRRRTPLVTATFTASNASLKPLSSTYTVRNISFNGTYTSRISDSHPVSSLRLDNLKAVLEGQPLTATLHLENFNAPLINLRLRSHINLDVLSKFWIPDTLEYMKGMLIADAVISGQAGDQKSWESTGTLDARDVSVGIRHKAVAFTNINGHFALQGNSLRVTAFSATAAGSDFNASGTIDNVYGYLLTRTEPVYGNISISSRNIDLNELLEDKKQSTRSDTAYRLDFDPRLRLNLALAIGMIQFRKFTAWQLKGNVALSSKILSTSNLVFKGFQGEVKLDGSLDASQPDSLLVTASSSVKNINIRDLFSEMGNFGQEMITSENVNGLLTADIRFISSWGKNLHCNMDKIYAKTSLTIENGELNNFKPMLALAKYVKGADLQKIKFNTLKNEIEIRRQTIWFPAMTIRSSALDVTASGSHSFNNVVDYRLQLYLSQLLGNKVRQQNTEFGTIEDDGQGRMKIFLAMTGPLSNPKISYDRKGVEQKITQDIRQEKQTFKEILRQEFGRAGKDSVKNVQAKKPKQEELQLDTGD